MTEVVGAGELANSVVHLYCAKRWPKRKIARALGTSRNTVRRILTKWQRQRDGVEEKRGGPLRPKKIAPWVSAIQDLLTNYPRLSAVRVHEELKDKHGFVGGHSIVKEAVRLLRHRPPDPVVRFETGPGEQAQMDWSDCTVHFAAGPMKLKCFSYILAYSRRKYIAFCPREDFFSLIRRHVEAFKHFGGCAHTCLYDNMKTVVLRWEADTPIYNPRFLLFATHYGFQPRACHPRRPQTKGKVERQFSYVKDNFLGGRRFHDLPDLNAQARRWLETVADVRIHGTTRRRPIDLWQEEPAHLQPLPVQAYETCQISYKFVSPEGLVACDGNAYSVPPAFIGQMVIARLNEHELVLLSTSCKEIARHALVVGAKGEKRRLPEHRIPKAEHGQVPLDLLRQRLVELGDFAKPFLVGLAKAHPRNVRAHICHILQLRETYDTGDVVNAIKRALEYNAFDHSVVERILSSHARPRSLEVLIARAGRAPDSVNLPVQRDASYYQNLFTVFNQGRKDEEDAAPGAGHEEPGDPEDDDGNADPA